MKNTKRWLALLLAVCMTVSTASPGALGSMQVAQAAEPQGLQLNETAVPRYSSIKITWDAQEGAAYTIERSDAADGEYTVLTENASGPEYIDENAGTGAVKYYRITNNVTKQAAEVFSNKRATGLEALKENAQFKWINDGTAVFDGTKALKFSGNDIAEVKELTSGTIITKGYQKSTSGGASVLLGFKKGTATGFFGTRQNRGDEWGWELGTNGLITGWNISFPDARYTGTASIQHVTGYVSPEKTPALPMLLSFDGRNKTNNNNPSYNWNSGSFGGFMKQMGVTEISIGGFVDGNGTVTNGWNGGIEYVIITDEVLTQEEIDQITHDESIDPDAPAVSGGNIGEMFNGNGDNSWVFTGGEDVQGGFSQTGGGRNYIGQFEEYVRWKKGSGTEYTRQRYTINTAKKGQTLKDIVSDWDGRVAAFDPRAAAYMVGAEDYSQGTAGIEDFKVQLKKFIDQSLAMRANKGFAVIQKPYVTADADQNAKIEAYCTAVDAVVKTYEAEAAKLGRIVVVDHYTQTKEIDNFVKTKLNADGGLNVWGHFEIGRQLCAATIKMTDGYPADIARLDEVAEPKAEVYSKVKPEVTASENALNVTIPEEADGTAWEYTLTIDAVEIRDQVSSKAFTISDLPAGKAYTLTIRTADGKIQMQTLAGKIADGEKGSKKTQELNDNQKALKEKMDAGEPMTWLFMGDSITHAAMWTNGYDGIAQSFEKFLKDDLGRTDDVVINTAVSGATTTITLANIEQRLEKYDPDVVSIMLGTNDCATGGYTPEKYKTELKQIIQKAKAKGATVILRTPTPGNRNAQLPPYIEKMKEVADEDPGIIYVDQFTEMKKAYDLYTYLFDDFYLDYTNGSGMGLHPAANGHLIMTRQFIRACGLWTDDAHIPNLFYQEINFANEKSAAQLPLTKSPDRIGLSVKELSEKTGKAVGSVTITATAKNGTKSYTTSTALGADAAILSNMKRNTTYDVTVKAYLKNSRTIVTFDPVEVSLSDSMEADFTVSLSNKKVTNLEAGAEVGTLAVSDMAPAGKYTYSLCEGTGADGNGYFMIDGDKLVVARKLTEKETYSVRVKAENGNYVKEQTFEIVAVGSGLIFEEKNVQITQGSSRPLTNEAYAQELMNLEEGTFIVQYTSTSSYIIQSLFSASNGTTGNNDRHFHVYVRDNGTLGYEIRNTNGQFNLGGTAANAVKVTYKGKAAKNTIAFKADKENQQYKLFANGKLVAAIDANAGYKFIKDITGVDRVNLGATIRGETAMYTFGGTIHYVKAYSVPLADEDLKKITGETAYDSLQQIFHSEDATGSNYFRIPALATTKKGTVIAAIDARFGGTHDSPNNIDTAVSRSLDGGKTWEKAVMPLYFDDYADDKIELPLGAQLRVNGSASFIDPQLLVDESSDRVFVIADAMPSGIGSPQTQAGSGYKTVNGKRYRMLKKAGEAAYHYSIHEDHYIYNDVTGQKTEYSVNERFEILKGGVLQTVKQKSVTYDPTSAGGTILVNTTDKDVAMNIMYDTAAFTVFPTNYLYMSYSDDQGETWSAPIDLNAQIRQEEQKYLIAGPGRGMQMRNGEHKGRLLVPVYHPNGCAVIYSDDHGVSWTYAAGPDVTAVGAMTESQIVEMPDGSLRVFARTYSGKIAEAASLDGGETWSAGRFTTIPQSASGTQLSVINYGGLVEGKPAVILSTPVGSSGRTDGRVKIGLITETDGTGADKYVIEWKYDYEVDAPSVGYSYSCLTELPNHNIGLLYEKYDSWASNMVQSKDVMVYEELSVSELRNKDSAEVIPVSAGNGTVSKRNIVDKGSEVTITAVPEEGCTFVNWTDEEKNVVSTDAEYTFTITETITLTANFERPAETGYRVKVVGGTIRESGLSEGNYEYNTKLTVTAEEPESGKIFAGWKVNATEIILSANKNYTFFVGSDLTLTAVYADETEESTIQPHAYLQNISTVKNDDGKYDVRYLAQLVVPEGWTIKQAGLVWSNKGETYTEMLDIQNEGKTGVKVTRISAISSTYQFSVTIKGVPGNIKVPGRVFAELLDSEGNSQIVQSEIGAWTLKQ